ncbi:DUF7743 domain-containing protein, partial [Terribacillus saccharophilus]|uniref:DUF7743 domain-containing protein n=1 Tax=Terribacillus saccharophilus TaxID=361277 RepID=UPI002989B6BF
MGKFKRIQIQVLALVLILSSIPWSTTESIAQGDIEAPTINKITYPEKITVGDPFQIKINATDDISGIKLAYVVITSPSGKQRLTKIDYSADSDGNYELLFDLGEYAEEGYWKITRIDLDDNAGNV